jgi:hypothetical protein
MVAITAGALMAASVLVAPSAVSADPRSSSPTLGVVERAKGTSTLTVRITVPRGKSTPNVVVSGPSGFATRTLTKTTTLRKLPAGTYTIEAKQSADGRIAPRSSARQTVQLGARKSATVQVTYQPTRIRFSLRGSAGIAQAAAASASGARSTESQLLTVREDGATGPAISEGNLSISRYTIIGDTMYADLGYPQGVDASGNLCVLVRIPRATGVPACLDKDIQQIIWPQQGFFRNDAVQVDAAGAVYYSGYVSNEGSVLRRSVDGVTRNLVSDGSYILDFLVQPDGSVLVAGESKTGARWTRLISASGSLRTLVSTGANFLARFDDGNIYMGLWGDSYLGVKRFLPATGQVEDKYWISGSMNGITPDMHINAEEFCADIWAEIESFCAWYGTIISQSIPVAGANLALAGSTADTVLMQYYPTLRRLDSGLKGITLGLAHGDRVVLAGLDPSNVNNVSIYDPATDTNRALLNSATEIEVYELDGASQPGKVLFAGLRFTDNQYVFGSIDVSSGAVEVLSNTGQKWQDFQTFG